MRLLLACTFSVLLSLVLAASDEKPHKPCTIRSPTTDRFFDLNSIHVKAPQDGQKSHKDDRTESWHAKGYDYGANFTLNFCGPVVEKIEDVVGIEKTLWKNVSAFYQMHGKTYALGLSNNEPVFRGRKLVLNYTGGSPCSSTALSKRSDNLHAREIIDHGRDDEDDNNVDDDDGDRKPSKPGKSKQRKKSTIISLLCESDSLAPQAAVSFVAASEDECTYFFEARSRAACGGIEKESQDLGPGGVFGVIFLIAIMAYLLGGCVYQRTVMHQRGWRQLPNYSVWAGIGSFIKDVFLIMTSSCARFLPSRRGYSRVSLNGDRRGRRSVPEDENRLIDQLDEEWDD